MIDTLKSKLPQIARYPRHLRSLLEHSNSRKFKNLMRVEWERRMGKTEVKGYPYVIYVDPCNVCNLRCPLCPGGSKKLEREQKMMTFGTYQSIMNKIKDYAYEVNLYNWGEPFLNPDIFRMIEYNHRNNIGTNISSNLSLSKPELAENIIKSGLEYLSISLDGASPEVYSKYRVKGSFDQVLENVQTLVKRKQELNSKTPFIEWQYIVMKHNEHQIAEAKRLAKEIKVDLIRFIPVRLIVNGAETDKKKMAEEWFPVNPAYRKHCFENFNGKMDYLHNESCFHLYRSLAINPDGGVHPCNIIYHPGDDFGNIFYQDFEEIWNNESYRSARALFAKKNAGPNGVPQTQTACHNCQIFRKQG